MKSHFHSLGHWLFFFLSSLAMPGGSNKSFSSVNWHMICPLSSCLWVFMRSAPHHKGFLALDSVAVQKCGEVGRISDLGHGLRLDMARRHLWHLVWLRTEEWAGSKKLPDYKRLHEDPHVAISSLLVHLQHYQVINGDSEVIQLGWKGRTTLYQYMCINLSSKCKRQDCFK